MKNINERAAEIHRRNYKWWHTRDGERLVRNREELLMLALSEVAEAMEGERKSLMDDKLPHRPMPEVEMADTAIRLLDYAAGNGIMIHDWVIPFEQLDYENRAASLFRICQTIVRIKLDAQCVSEALTLIERYCIMCGYSLWAAIDEKLAFNDTRKDHTWEAREAVNGKKF